PVGCAGRRILKRRHAMRSPLYEPVDPTPILSRFARGPPSKYDPALRSKRPGRRGPMHESKPPSDALVFFGATGDLAYKKIFPALQSLTRRGRLNVPVIGVAFSGWNRDQLIARAKASCTEYGGLDPAAFEKLSANLRYVDGDYKDPKTFERLKSELGKAKRPTQYLAIPPSMFTTVAEGLAKAGAAEDARVVVEKPFGRDL